MEDVVSRPRLATLEACAGVGMLSEGIHAACEHLGIAYQCVGYIERDGYAASALVARMADASLAPAPIWDDLATFDGEAWRGKVDCIAAGFPCQPWSTAGKRAGTDDARWLWPILARLIEDVRPSIVFLENVPGLCSGGIPGWSDRWGGFHSVTENGGRELCQGVNQDGGKGGPDFEGLALSLWRQLQERQGGNGENGSGIFLDGSRYNGNSSVNGLSTVPETQGRTGESGAGDGGNSTSGTKASGDSPYGRNKTITSREGECDKATECAWAYDSAFSAGMFGGVLSGAAIDAANESLWPGLSIVLRSLASLGFNAEWCHLSAKAVGASHKRERVFILANAAGTRGQFIGRSDGRTQGTGESQVRSGRVWRWLRSTVDEQSESCDSAMADAGRTGHQERRCERRNTEQEREAVERDCNVVADSNREGLRSSGIGCGESCDAEQCDETLADAASGRFGELRQPPGSDGQFDGSGIDVEHAESERCEVAGSSCEIQGHHAADALERGSIDVADTEYRTPRDLPAWREGLFAGPADGGHQLFAPGPGDISAWSRAIADSPQCAPAVEPSLCVLADGLALVVDEGRADQLRCAGNGVVALQAGVAFVELGRRAGLWW